MTGREKGRGRTCGKEKGEKRLAGRAGEAESRGSRQAGSPRPHHHHLNRR